MGKGSGTCDRPALSFVTGGEEGPREETPNVDNALRITILRQRQPYSGVRQSRLKNLAREHFDGNLEAAERALDVLVTERFVAKREELHVEHDADGSKTIERHVDYRNLPPAKAFLAEHEHEARRRREAEKRKEERIRAREGTRRLKGLEPAAKEIMTHLFEVGMSQPNESRLKEALDMTQSEVRGALKELREDRLLYFRKRRGSGYWSAPAHYVLAPDAQSARTHLAALAVKRGTSITALLS